MTLWCRCVLQHRATVFIRQKESGERLGELPAALRTGKHDALSVAAVNSTHTRKNVKWIHALKTFPLDKLVSDTLTVCFNFILLISLIFYLPFRLLSGVCVCVLFFCSEWVTVQRGVKPAQISGSSIFQASSWKQKCKDLNLASNIPVSKESFILTEEIFFSFKTFFFKQEVGGG